MLKKLLTALLIALAVILIMAVIMLFFPRNGNDSAEESSGTDSLAATDMLIVPSDMPEGISMNVPQGFEETSSQYYKKYYIKEDASVIITGEDLTFKISEIDGYTQSVIEQYQESADDFLLLSDEVFTVSGTRAHLLEFSYAIVSESERQDFKCTTAVMIKGNNAFLVTCKSHAETYQNYREIFRMALNSIRLSDPAAGTNAPEQTPVEQIPQANADQPAETQPAPEDSVQP